MSRITDKNISLRTHWYNKPKKKIHKEWTDTEQTVIYNITRKGVPVKEVIKLFLPLKITPTQIHNQIRLFKKGKGGLCSLCSKKLSKEEKAENKQSERRYKLCSKHVGQKRAYRKKRREISLGEKLCPYCHKRPVAENPDKSILKSCVVCISATYRRRKEKGLCGLCGIKKIDITSSVSQCSSCLEKGRKKRAKRYY